MFQKVTVNNQHFQDELGRSLLLRGINIASKTPLTGIGRPFPLEKAAEHFARLAYWGINVVRLGIPWEAVEPTKLGAYDEAYLNYLDQLVKLAGEAGLKVLVDFHQDVWSRFTGGSGAPAWTLESVGFKVDALEASGAAILDGKKRHHILWPTNGYKLAAASMFTLFFRSQTIRSACRDRSSKGLFRDDDYGCQKASMPPCGFRVRYHE